MLKESIFSRLLFLLFTLTTNVYCQSFINGDLEGNINGISSLPDFWQKIPVGDINCLANGIESDSPDLLSLTMPDTSVGLHGNPFSGSTFIGGYFMLASTNPYVFAHEGIMQNVSGFEIAHIYEIHLRQTVVKLIGARDNSGSWAIYIDSLLAGITTVTYSDEPYSSNNLQWEDRSVLFTATSSSHLIKFLPMDNDNNNIPSTSDTTGALYMGLDSVALSLVTNLKEIKNNNFQVLANTGKEFIYIQSTRQVNDIQIFDTQGKVILEIIPNESMSFILSTLNFTNGLYILKIKSGDEVIHKKIVVLN